MSSKEIIILNSPFGEKGEIQFIIAQLKETFEGDPWYGRCMAKMVAEIDEQTAFEKPAGQHSILDLVWHIITWREFTIDRLQQKPQMQLQYFEENDWRRLDYSDKTLWRQVRERLQRTQDDLLQILKKQKDDILEKKVADRNYTFRKLLYGVIQHDIYHLGQIAYIRKTQQKQAVLL